MLAIKLIVLFTITSLFNLTTCSQSHSHTYVQAEMKTLADVSYPQFQSVGLNQKKVILMVYMPGCPHCRNMD